MSDAEVTKPKFQKMKFAGYACIVFAALLTILVVFGITNVDRIGPTQALIGTWLLTGTGLLTANAGKRIAGHAVANKTGTEL